MRNAASILGLILAHNPLIQSFVHLFWRRNPVQVKLCSGGSRCIFGQNVLAQINALVTDKNLIRTGNQPVNFFLRPFAKRTYLNI